MSSTRRYSDSSDDENPEKRRKISDKYEIEDRLESLISRVGDKSTSSSLESNLEGLAGVLEADLGNHKQKIFKIILNCAIDLPQRLTVYSTLVGLLNVKNYSAGGDFVDMLMTYFKDALKDNNYFTAVYLMRFLSDLVNCKVVMPSSMLDFYNLFLDAAFEENMSQTRSDWLVYAVLSCLPWSGYELNEKKELELDRLLSSIGGYLERRNRDFIAALVVWDDEDQEASNRQDKLDSLWIQIQDMRRSNWKEKMLRRPYQAFDSVFRDAHTLQHTIPTITIPPYDKRLTPLPKMVFRIFDYSDLIEDTPRLPKAHSIDRFIVEEVIQATIHSNCMERKACADALLNIEFKEKVPLNYLIIEAIFGQLFQLPESPYIHLMYGVLLIELCKIQPSSMPQVLAQATMILYSKLDTMNATCIQRFSEWFAYHLSNFQFKWMWEDWIDCINCNQDSRKTKFVQETLRKCLRLSYHQRVVDIVPSSFAELLPPEPLPINKFADAEDKIKEEADKVIAAVRSKYSVDDMKSILTEINVEGEYGKNNHLAVDIFLTSLLFLASKTPSYSYAAIARYHPTLKMLTEGNTKQETLQLQITLLNSLQDIWKNKPLMILILVDKFLMTQLVTCSSVVSWIFSPRMEPVITSFHVHEILDSTLKKLKLQVDKERKQLEKDLSKSKRRNDDDDDDEDDNMGEESETSANLEKFTREMEGLELLILEKLISTLMDQINACEAQGMPYKTYKFDYLTDRLKGLLLKSRSIRVLSELKSKYYDKNLHISILKVFEMVQPLLQ